MALSRLAKPHYIFRPSQIVRRALADRDDPEPLVQTPWGCRMRVAREDVLGAGIARTGIHELGVSEVMWRLADGDELALDVGANIGYFTGLLSCRAQAVVAFEPNPRLHRFIAGNIGRWEHAGRVTLDTRAASNRNGTATLHLPSAYDQNFGIASLASATGDDGATYEIDTVRLDDFIAGRRVGVLKIDVEGHELPALEGAGDSLAGGLIRDVVFEEHRPLPSPVSRMLESAGFTIQGIEQAFTHPLLISGRAPRGWDAPTYLATRDPERTQRLMRPSGWRCLRAAGWPGEELPLTPKDGRMAGQRPGRRARWRHPRSTPR
jgi:FkbM family methyltransferase